MNKKEKTIWIFAGESSGDLYGARLAESLLAQDPAVNVKGMGGIEMRDAGVDIMVDSTELGVVGFVEVLKHLPLFKRIFRELVERAAKERPDTVVLIDYPGFNLRFAKEMKKLGIRVVYYVSPQVWAWGKKRLKLIPQIVDKMMVIFPFEVDVYKGTGLDTVFIGHPLVKLLHENEIDEPRDKNTILLLPGSRFSELKRLLKPLLLTAKKLHEENPDYKFVLATPRRQIQEFVENSAKEMNLKLPLQVTCGDTNYWLQKASAGIASSGTVTVQAAILGLPLVTVYRLSPLTYLMGKLLVDLPFFTMINIITKREVYQEFLQGQVRADVLAPALKAIMPGGERIAVVEKGMNEMVKLLGGMQDVSANAAKEVLTGI